MVRERKVDTMFTEYQVIRETNLMAYLDENSRQNLVFQQHNASVHVSRSAKQWCEARRSFSLSGQLIHLTIT